MTDTQTPPNRDAVAPELQTMLDRFPGLDFSNGIAPFRTSTDERPPIELPADLAAVTCTQSLVPGQNGQPDVRVLRYQPPTPAPSPRPAVLHIHGGGYVIGSPELNDPGNRAMSLAQDCIVVSVDYRLAPECVWPGALEDCYAVLVWLHANAAELGIDPARIAVAGESAGGGHAVALALLARDRHRLDANAPLPCFLLLDSPMLDDRTGSNQDQAPHPHCGHFIWTPEINRFGWQALLGVEPGSSAVPDAAVPARAGDLSGLPPHFISVGALDLFVEEDMEWARRLIRAGIPVEFHIIPGAYHGYSMAHSSPQWLKTVQWRNAALTRAFAVQA